MRLVTGRQIALPLAACLAVFIVIGWARDQDGTTRSAGVSSDPRWPAETLVDWVGFADQVSVLEIVSERQLPMQAEVATIGEGYVGREVGARIDSTLWQRPGAPTITGELYLRVWGWLAHAHNLTPIRPRLEVGDRVLAALVKTPDGPWALLSEGAAIPITSAGATPTDVQLRAYPRVAAPLQGRSLAQIASLLAATRPNSLAAKYQHLDADARASAVWAEILEPNSLRQP